LSVYVAKSLTEDDELGEGTGVCPPPVEQSIFFGQSL